MENPVKEMVMEGAAFARENGCDFIVALGGAVLDSAVAVAAMTTNPGDLWDYVNGGTGKGQPLVNPGLPIVSITLTAGTGSEVNCWGVISNLETKEKIGFGYPELTPVLAVVDPELMKTVPAKYTAYCDMCRATKSYSHKGRWRNLARSKRKSLRKAQGA